MDTCFPGIDFRGRRHPVETARRAVSTTSRVPGSSLLLAGLTLTASSDTCAGLLGHYVHKMVKFALRNPKLEFRNPKQTRNPNFKITKNAPLVGWSVLSFQFGTFDIVSDFELRISSLVSAV